MPGILQLIPVGSTARALVRELAEPIHREYGLEVQLGASLTEPKYAFNKDRGQFHSTAILRRLATTLAKDHLGALGVAEVDLFVPDMNFVFGEADRESHTAIISLARLRPEFEGGAQNVDLLRARARAEAVHEVGHLVGLSHCEDVRCVMFFSNTVADTDRKGATLCGDCRGELGRLAKQK